MPAMSHQTHARAALLASLCCGLAAPAAFAQCDPAWQPAASLPGVNGEVDAMTAWDPDGPGPLAPVFVAGGLFTSAGGVPAPNIAVWDGAAWAPLGAGVNGYVLALAAHPSGDLYAAGTFTTAGDAPASRIARWDGAQWHALGSGCDSSVYALTVLPTGDVIAGGAFDAAGGSTARFVARWSPSSSTWSPLGAGFNDIVFALAARPSGELFAGGWFTLTGGAGVRSIARWTGTAWSSLGAGIPDGGVFTLAVGPGGDLYAGGEFLTAGAAPANHIARWSGTGGSGTWSALGPGIGDEFDDLVFSIAVRPDGSVIAAGRLTDLFGTGLNHIGAWNGTTWSPLGSGINGVVVYAAANMPGGDLAAGGLFSQAGGVPVDSLARWGSAGTLSIDTQPQDVAACPGGPAQFTVAAAGASAYQWRHDGAPIELAANPTAQSPTLLIAACTAADAGVYDCLVAGSCGSAASDPAALLFCAADLNCDGLVDFADYLEFLNFYDAQNAAADFNQDGLVDFADYLEFLNLYDAGC